MGAAGVPAEPAQMAGLVVAAAGCSVTAEPAGRPAVVERVEPAGPRD
jgi:hypothetical protein